MSKIVISLEKVTKSFNRGKNKIKVLQDASLEIKQGEAVALIGPSGSGKSTLLQIAGLLDRPSSGKIFIKDEDCTKVSDAMRNLLRNKEIGFVYQFHHLMPEFSALENVMMPGLIAGKSVGDTKEAATDLLKKLGLASRISHRPAELSGGEQQRVAIARAIVNNPSLLLADEPTGNLDPATSKDVFSLLLESAKSAKLAMLIVTHNHELASQMDRTVTIKEGEIVSFSKAKL